MTSTQRILSWFAGIALALIVASPTIAQPYPNRPIRIIVPYAAGGGADVWPRSLQQRLVENLGQPVIFDNKPGAFGSIGAREAVAAKPDGYTFVVTASGVLTIYPHLAELGFDPLTALVPVGMIGAGPHAIAVNAKLPINSVKELIDYAKARPGKVNFASSGHTSLSRLSVELFMRATGTDMFHIPYQSGAPAAIGLGTGETQVAIPDLGSISSVLEGGLIRVLAVTTPQRSAVAPNLPTVAETGVPGYSLTAWVGVFAPAGTPPEAIARMNAAINFALAQNDVRDRLLKIGGDPMPGPPEQLGKVMREDHEKYGKVIKEVGIKMQ